MKLPRSEFVMLAVCAAAGLWFLCERQRQAQQASANPWLPAFQ